MPDESRFPTMRLMRCNKCHAVYAARQDGPNECPECSNNSAAEFKPGQEEKNGLDPKRLNGEGKNG